MGTHVCVPLTKQHGGQEDTSLALGSERDPVNYRMHNTQHPPLTTLCAYALPPTTVLTHAYNTRERERSKILKTLHKAPLLRDGHSNCIEANSMAFLICLLVFLFVCQLEEMN